MPATVHFADLSAAYDDGVLGAPYRITGEVDLDTAFGTWTLPLGHEGTVPLLDPPTLDLVDVDVSLEGTGVRLAVALKLGLPGWCSSRRCRGRSPPPTPCSRAAPPPSTPRAHIGRRLARPHGHRRGRGLGRLRGRGEVRIDLAGALTTPLGTVPVLLPPLRLRRVSPRSGLQPPRPDGAFSCRCGASSASIHPAASRTTACRVRVATAPR
ncbi:MAG: hypothetical protein R3F59_26170 [Myxococcota bacterium]